MGRRPFTGARIETPAGASPTAASRVAPSQGRGSKPRRQHHPAALVRRRPFTGARIETALVEGGAAGRGGRPSKGARIETMMQDAQSQKVPVAPSRGRGSKRQICGGFVPDDGRPFTGARIETTPSASPHPSRRGRPFTGARIETATGAWMTTTSTLPPHGGADRNNALTFAQPYLIRCPFTAARIETPNAARGRRTRRVAPSRARGSKRRYGTADRVGDGVAPSRGARIKTLPGPRRAPWKRSLLHGRTGRNFTLPGNERRGFATLRTRRSDSAKNYKFSNVEYYSCSKLERFRLRANFMQVSLGPKAVDSNQYKLTGR